MIPVFIVSYNRLTTLKGMLEYFAQIPELKPIVIDNASTYPPLLEFFERDRSFELIRLTNNIGPWSCFTRNFHLGFPSSNYFAFSDCDLDLSGVPLDVIRKMKQGLKQHPERIKVGISLEINDLPKHDIHRYHFIQGSEKICWQKKLGEYWDVNVDTTFALYRNVPQVYKITDSLRLDRPYTGRHVPWYNDPANLDEEERYYLAHARRDCSYYTRHDQKIQDDQMAKRIMLC